MSRRLVPVAAALVAAIALVLGGCTVIPRSGPVNAGGSVQQRSNDSGQIEFRPVGPQLNASQESILDGFLSAAVSPAGGFQVARGFLSAEFSTQWNPDASVTIDNESARTAPVRVSDTEQRIDVHPAAFLDASGGYLAAASPAPIPLQYSFVKEGGQWRISKAPDGIVIDEARFQDVFTSRTLYFFSPDFAFLVPDERWFPATESAAATQVVRALLAGPAKWLAGSVVSAFPAGAQLAGTSVPTRNGAAQVALNAAAASADQQAVDRMYAQLETSLSSTSSVGAVQLTIDGVDRSGVLPANLQRDPSVGPSPVVVKGGALGTLSGDAVAALPGVGKTVGALTPSAVSVSATGTVAAVLAHGSVYAVRGTDSSDVDDRAGLVAPSLDTAGDVWSVPSGSPDDFRITAPGVSRTAITAAWPNAASLAAFAVSRDGTRVAALVRTTSLQLHLMVAGIQPDSSGRPGHLGDPIDLGGTGLTAGRALTWVDELTLGVLGGAPQAPSEVVIQVIGGMRSNEAAPAGAVSLAAGSAGQLWALTDKGSLQSLQGSGWQQVTAGVGVLATALGRLP